MTVSRSSGGRGQVERRARGRRGPARRWRRRPGRRPSRTGRLGTGPGTLAGDVLHRLGHAASPVKPARSVGWRSQQGGERRLPSRPRRPGGRGRRCSGRCRCWPPSDVRGLVVDALLQRRQRPDVGLDRLPPRRDPAMAGAGAQRLRGSGAVGAAVGAGRSRVGLAESAPAERRWRCGAPEDVLGGERDAVPGQQVDQPDGARCCRRRGRRSRRARRPGRGRARRRRRSQISASPRRWRGGAAPGRCRSGSGQGAPVPLAVGQQRDRVEHGDRRRHQVARAAPRAARRSSACGSRSPARRRRTRAGSSRSRATATASRTPARRSSAASTSASSTRCPLTFTWSSARPEELDRRAEPGGPGRRCGRSARRRANGSATNRAAVAPPLAAGSRAPAARRRRRSRRPRRAATGSRAASSR